MTNRKDYQKAWREAHKEQVKANKKAWREAHKKEVKSANKAYYQANKEEIITKKKVYNQANKEQYNAYKKAYSKSDVNALGQTKHSIRVKSKRILKKSGIKIPGYQIHHCFGYEDASKFIYCSKSLHLKIHAYLKEHNIDAGKDHWMQIRDIVNSTYEFVYIKA